MTADRIRASQIDIVDSSDVVRATLTCGDDFDGKRIAPFAGLIIRDRSGLERGGIGVIDLDGEDRVATVLDHRGGDAVGTMVTDDGEVTWAINDATSPDGTPRSTRVQIRIAQDGTPSLTFLDDKERPRLRLTLDAEGAGAIQFIRADGSVAHQLSPENSGQG